jgi:predicted ATPase
MSAISFIQSEGGLLPADLLSRIRARDPSLPGIRPVDYGLAPGETLSEAASRSWARLTGLWRRFHAAWEQRAQADAFEAETLDLWLKPLFQELGFGTIERVRAETIGRDTFAISHRWDSLPIHLVGAGLHIDRRTPGARGAALANPHGLLQDFINRRDDFLWGVVSNGLRLRLLRDNRTLTRQAYVEFDLERIFSAEDQSGYTDFFLLWLVCHCTRFQPLGGGAQGAAPAVPGSNWLIEQWTTQARQHGLRLQLGLRHNAVRALNHLGSGLLSHRANGALRERLATGALTQDNFKRQLLRTLYRLLFLFVTEDRGLLLAPEAAAQARDRYQTYYSTARLRRIACRYSGTAHGDGWVQLQTLFRLLRLDAGCGALGLPPLGSFLFSEGASPDIDSASLSNEHLYATLRALCLVRDSEEKITRVTDFEHLGAEELGSIYESLLELQFLRWEIAAGVAELGDAEGSGNERKLTGSFYTPTSLITSLLDTALEPVIERTLNSAREAAKDAQPSSLNAHLAEALLRLKICDPACGSGHFLVAAAHRIARRMAALRTGEREPPVQDVRHALREVAAHCLYGVDLNLLSVELCKVSIWLEAFESGRPLAFLESHIQCGNSLLGCMPALLKKGLPDEAFKPLTGDDPAAARKLAADNRDLSSGQELLELASEEPLDFYRAVPSAFARVESLPDDSPPAVRQKETEWQQVVASAEYQRANFLHDAWCAAFVLPRPPNDFTYQFHTGHLQKLERNPDDISPALRDAIEKIAGNAPQLTEQERDRSYRFFHWHLRFPEVFRLPPEGEKPTNPVAGWSGGFDVILGNPPWEHTELKEKEFFETRAPAIVGAQTGAERKRMIEDLATTDPNLYADFIQTKRFHEGVGHFIASSGRYPLCGRGRISTHAAFSELNVGLTHTTGRAGFIVPFGIATSDTTSDFFDSLVTNRRLASLLQLENTKKIFPAVHPDNPFVLLTVSGRSDPVPLGKFVFCAERVEELTDPERKIELTPEDIARINPNTRTCPIFRTRRDAEITKGIYNRLPVLLLEACDKQPEVNPWGVWFRQGLFNMTSDSRLFVTRVNADHEGWNLNRNRFIKAGQTMLPLYEAKLFHQFDHRWATYLNAEETRDLAPGEKADPSTLIMPRYWVDDRDCLLVAASAPSDLTAAAEAAWSEATGNKRPVAATSEPVNQKTAGTLRRELARWVAGCQMADGDAHEGENLLRQVLSEDGKKRNEKKWRDEYRAALALAQTNPLTRNEMDALQLALDQEPAEGLDALWPILRVRVPRWFLAFRDVTNATNERTSIFSPIPWAGVGHTAPLVFPSAHLGNKLYCLEASMSSFALDYCSRQKVSGTHLTYNLLQQLCVPAPIAYEQPAQWNPAVILADWLRPYVLELCFTAHDLVGFAENCGHAGPPFRWDDARRAQLRAEVDAAFFHLYGLNRADTEYVLDSFDVLKRREVNATGRFETAERILTAYDAMAAAMSGGPQFVTRLDPPPAHPSLTHDIVRHKRIPMHARITSATIRNYRSLASDSPPVPLGPVTLLVGPNGSGKSSFCDALAFLADSMRLGLPAAIDNKDNRRGFLAIRRKGAESICIRVDAELEGITGYYELELTGSAGGYRVAREAAQWRSAFAIKSGEWESGKRLEGASIPVEPTSLLLPKLQGDAPFYELANTIARAVVYSLPPIELRQSRPKSPANPMEGRGRDWPSALDAILKSESKGVLVVALNRIAGDIVDARVTGVARQQVVEFLHRNEGKPDRWASADQESDGTLRAAAILTALVQAPPPSLIAIEEPELAIHPAALTVIRDFILDAQRRSQILITTHSPELLDHFEADLVRVVHRVGDVTRVSPMDEDQREAVRGSLTTLADVLRHEGIKPAEPSTESGRS